MRPRPDRLLEVQGPHVLGRPGALHARGLQQGRRGLRRGHPCPCRCPPGCSRLRGLALDGQPGWLLHWERSLRCLPSCLPWHLRLWLHSCHTCLCAQPLLLNSHLGCHCRLSRPLLPSSCDTVLPASRDAQHWRSVLNDWQQRRPLRCGRVICCQVNGLTW